MAKLTQFGIQDWFPKNGSSSSVPDFLWSKSKQQSKFAAASGLKEYKKLLKETLKELGPDSDEEQSNDVPVSFTQKNEDDCYGILWYHYNHFLSI